MLPLPKQRPRPRGPQSSAKQRVLAHNGGVDVTPLEVAQKVSARTVGDLIPKVLTGFRIEQKRGEIEIVKVWNDLIDPNIVAHAQPTGLNKGTSSSPWTTTSGSAGNRPLQAQRNPRAAATQLRSRTHPADFVSRRLRAIRFPHPVLITLKLSERQRCFTPFSPRA